jgi:hypothetical protein
MPLKPKALSPSNRRIGFVLDGYRVIQEFMKLLKRSELLELPLKRRGWEGQHFAAYINPFDTTRVIGFRDKDGGLMLSFSAEEWQRLNELFDKALTMPEVQDLFEQFI